MSIDFYVGRDIARILRAVGSVDRSAQAAYFDKGADFQSAYHLGFHAALRAVGLAFGLEPMVDQEGDRGPIWIEAFTND